MDLGIAGRRAIACASSRGGGRACDEALVQEGVAVTINGRSPESLAEAARAIRAATYAPSQTVLGGIESERTRSALLEVCPEPDIPVNNNGGPPQGRYQNLQLDGGSYVGLV